MMSAVMQQLRPPVPVEDAERCTELVALMENCWHRSANNRPSFSTVASKLQDIHTAAAEAEPEAAAAEEHNASLASTDVRRLIRTDADIKAAVKAWCGEWEYDYDQG